MYLYSSELAHNYSSYTFGYTNYCKREVGDTLTDIYDLGYLPYSGSRDILDTLYMARSSRVPLAEFSLSSENRRIAKKFDGVFTSSRIPIAQFDINEPFINFCLDYFKNRHGEHTMPRERLMHILSAGLISTIIEYRQDSSPVAYVFEVEEGVLGHYWYSFYDTSYTQQSLGLWLMQDALRSAKERGLTHYYLGTVYGDKALYKTNFEPLEWWSGSEWVRNTSLLKERGRSDTVRTTTLTDAWKEGQSLF